MRVWESAALLVVGTVFLTFTALSFGLFPRALSWENPTLMVEALAVAGGLFFVLGVRGLYELAHEGANPPLRRPSILLRRL